MIERLLQFLQRIGLISPNTVYYIGGADVLPPPLKGQEEQDALTLLEQGEEDANNVSSFFYLKFDRFCDMISKNVII